MALLTRSKPTAQPSSADLAAQGAASLDDAWQAFRAEVLEARKRARKEQRKAARSGQMLVPLILMEPEPPADRPTWFGASAQPRGADGPLVDRDGRPLIEDPATGRLVRADQAPAPAQRTETQTMHMPAGPHELTVSTGATGDEPGEEVHRIDPAALRASLRGISIEAAREELEAAHEDAE